jgi:predicted component of type VI protein secretion system
VRYRLTVQPESPAGAPPETYDLDLTAEYVVLGRAPESPVPLDGRGISRSHLSLAAAEGWLYLSNLSANGVWINGSPVSRNAQVRFTPDDMIGLPGYTLRLASLETPPPPPNTGPITREIDIAAATPDAALQAHLPEPGVRSLLMLDRVERLVLILVALSVALLMLYRSS